MAYAQFYHELDAELWHLLEIFSQPPYGMASMMYRSRVRFISVLLSSAVGFACGWFSRRAALRARIAELESWQEEGEDLTSRMLHYQRERDRYRSFLAACFGAAATRALGKAAQL